MTGWDWFGVGLIATILVWFVILAIGCAQYNARRRNDRGSRRSSGE